MTRWLPRAVRAPRREQLVRCGGSRRWGDGAEEGSGMVSQSGIGTEFQGREGLF